MLPALYSPPKQFAAVPVDSEMQKATAAHGVDILADYRGNIDGATYSIIIERFPAHGMNADEMGVRRIAAMISVRPQPPQQPATPVPCPSAQPHCAQVYHVDFSAGKLLASKPVTLCANRQGWLDKTAMTAGDRTTTIAQVFTRAGDYMYDALMSYATPATGAADVEASLLSLCPPEAAPTPQPHASPLPVAAPGGWIAQAIPADRIDGLRVDARWMRLGPSSNVIDYLAVYEKPGSNQSTSLKAESDDLRASLGELSNMNVSADHAAPLCGGQSGWASTATGDYTDGHAYVVETVVGYANDTWYSATYTRRADDPEDPAARATLLSLCPRP